MILVRASGLNKSYLSSTCLEGDVSEESGMGSALLKESLLCAGKAWLHLVSSTAENRGMKGN